MSDSLEGEVIGFFDTFHGHVLCLSCACDIGNRSLDPITERNIAAYGANTTCDVCDGVIFKQGSEKGVSHEQNGADCSLPQRQPDDCVQ